MYYTVPQNENTHRPANIEKFLGRSFPGQRSWQPGQGPNKLQPEAEGRGGGGVLGEGAAASSPPARGIKDCSLFWLLEKASPGIKMSCGFDSASGSCGFCT